LLFVGVKATGPILNHSASEYVNGQHLADLQVTSTLGLTEDDIDAAEKSGAHTEAAYQFYYVANSDEVVQVTSYDPSQELNQLLVKDGRLPEKADEIVVVEDGYIVERGSHTDLLAHQGVYAQLHKMQFGA